MWIRVLCDVRRLFHVAQRASGKAVESRCALATAYPQVARFAGEMLKKEKFAKCALFAVRALAPKPWYALVCRLRRARSPSRSKPRTKAVGGSRKSAGWVDERETDSASGRASSGRPFHFRGKCKHFPRGAFLEGGRLRRIADVQRGAAALPAGGSSIESRLDAPAYAVHRTGGPGVSVGGCFFSLPL